MSWVLVPHSITSLPERRSPSFIVVSTVIVTFDAPSVPEDGLIRVIQVSVVVIFQAWLQVSVKVAETSVDSRINDEGLTEIDASGVLGSSSLPQATKASSATHAAVVSVLRKMLVFIRLCDWVVQIFKGVFNSEWGPSLRSRRRCATPWRRRFRTRIRSRRRALSPGPIPAVRSRNGVMC